MSNNTPLHTQWRRADDDADFQADLSDKLPPEHLAAALESKLITVGLHALWLEGRRRGIFRGRDDMRTNTRPPELFAHRSKYRRLADAFIAVQLKFVGKPGPHAELSALSCAIYAVFPRAAPAPAADDDTVSTEDEGSQ